MQKWMLIACVALTGLTHGVEKEELTPTGLTHSVEEEINLAALPEETPPAAEFVQPKTTHQFTADEMREPLGAYFSDIIEGCDACTSSKDKEDRVLTFLLLKELNPNQTPAEAVTLYCESSCQEFLLFDLWMNSGSLTGEGCIERNRRLASTAATIVSNLHTRA